MDALFLNSATIGVTISLASYAFGNAIRKRWNFSFLNPLLISIIMVIGFLLIFHVDYDVYYESAKYLSYLLAPATVSLAIPLYQHLELLKEHASAVFVGILAGVLTSLTSVLILAFLFCLSHEQYVTLLPKSITTAIGMGVSEEIGGYVTITTAVIIITGVFGNMTADVLCRLFKIRNSISIGLAIGTSSHAIGTSRAMEMGKIEGAMSSLAIVISGLCTVIGATVFAEFL